MVIINVERLRMLIEFLRDLPPKMYNNRRLVSAFRSGDTGLVCNAIGWTPELFPDLIEWSRQGHLLIYNTRFGPKSVEYDEAADLLFDIDSEIASDLFCEPKMINTSFSSKTPQQMADTLEGFIEMVKNGEIEGHGVEDD